MRAAFRQFAGRVSDTVGTPAAFIIALLFCVAWGASGPLFHYSDTWQLIVNTVTSIVTFLMVFVIQHSQNRDTAAMQLKLDEILRAVEGARSSMIRLEDLPDEELGRLQEEMRRHRDRRAGEREPS